MTAKVFRSAVYDNVRTESQRTLQIRRKESIVNDGKFVMLFSDLRNCFNVCDREKRVCRSLDIYSLYVIIDGGLNSFKIGSVYYLIGNIEILEYVIEDPESSAVDIV
jgi:hypothetical protein